MEELKQKVAALEMQVAALEAKFKEEIDRLYHVEFPSFDEQIHRAIQYADESAKRSSEENSERVSEVAHRLNAAEAKEAEAVLEAVNRLLAGSSSELVAAALIQALQSVVLKTRPATREELRSGDGVIAIRQATSQELRNH